MYKLIVVLACVFFSTSCCAQHKFEWLIGTWKVKDKPVYETWKHTDNEEILQGISYRIQNSDTVITERILLTYSRGYYHYIPETPQNKHPIDFKVTNYTDDGFIAENPNHDFPKLIRYTIVRKANGDFLEAAIEGNGKVIPYSFERIR